MANILVLVTSSVTDHAHGLAAIRYCDAAIAQGHNVKVFFYSDGVSCANSFIQPAGDELNLHQKWLSIGQQESISLIVCNTAAARRGVIPQEEASEVGFNMTAPFSAGGLAEFAVLSQETDCLVQF